MLSRALRLLGCFAGVVGATLVVRQVIPVNASTAGFVYLLLILVIASTWGFLEAAVSSLLATLAFNFYFFPPVGTLTIEDPQNWVALLSFLTTSLIASRLSTKARREARDALARQHDIERLYSFSRGILLIGGGEAFPRQLVRRLAETFEFSAVVLFDRRSGEFYRAGPRDFDGLDQQVREAALDGVSFSDERAQRVIAAVRLGTEPIAALAVEGPNTSASVAQSIANLVAIGLERAKAQEMAQELEAARQSEQLRTTLIDAMAHEFKTPLTLIKGATSAVLAEGEALPENTREQLTIADEEAEHLRDLMDDAIEMARLDTARIEVSLDLANIQTVVREVLASMHAKIDGRPVELAAGGEIPAVPLDRRLVKLALKQLLDNALKYSPPDSPLAIRVEANGETVAVEVTDHGPGISPEEIRRIFERFYRGRTARREVPGSGLGLTIAHSIVDAHHGELTVRSRPGETAFRMALPLAQAGGAAR